MKAKYLLVMCLIVNNCQIGKPTNPTEISSIFDEGDVDFIDEWETDQLEQLDFSLSKAIFDDPIEMATDQVLEAIWSFADNNKQGYIRLPRFGTFLPKDYHINVQHWLLEHRFKGKINKDSFKLILYATINLPDLRKWLSSLQRTKN